MAGEYLVSKKYHEISMLAGETAKQASKNGEEWMKYLTTAARLYKYPFEDQMLIYAQRPDASACATMETWNEKMFCWVNRGAKGIALFDRESERPKLKYVFDVSDVHKSRRLGKDPYLWEIREEHKDIVLAQLEKTYGATNKDNSFESRLMEMAGRIAEDYYVEIMQDMSYAKEGSFLEELDDLNVGMRLRETLSASIAYTLLSRCGADMDLWKDELNFDYISEFNTTKALSVIGNATTDMCKPILIEIGKTVAAYDRHIARNKAKEKANGVQIDNTEKNPEKVLAKAPEPRYNALKRESESKPQTETITNHIETEGIAYGTDIRKERGLPDTQPDTRQRAGGAADQVWADEEELPEGTPEGDLQRASADGRIESALSGDTEAGRGEDGLPDGADGESRGSGRGIESVRSDEMGVEDEQHQALSGGNRTDGAGLQSLNSGSQQDMETEKPENGENSLSGSFLDNIDFAEKAMEIQKGLLCSDDFLIHKRPEIAGYFAVEQDTMLQTEYFKNCFRFGTYYGLKVADTSIGFHANEEGLHINMTGKTGAENETLLSWEDARFFVNSYIEDDIYLLPGEKAEQIDTNGMYQQLDLFSMFTEQVGSIAMKEAEQGIIPAEKASPEPKKEVLPKEQLDAILQSGGGRENSRKRIYAKYQQDKTPEEMSEFLKKEYGTTGKGFEFEGKQVSVWFNEQGMTAGYGTSALENPKFILSWQEIEKEIRLQVENGTYMGANEAYLVDEVERGRIATFAAYFFYDGIGEMPEEIFQKVGNRSDAHAKMVELLSSPEGIDLVTSCMDKALHQLEMGEKKLRIRSVMSKEELRAELDNLLLEKKTFPVSDRVEVKKENFITQDEIDHRLGGGSSFHHGSFRIYDYFMEGHDSKEAADFLKNEYGTGGCSHALTGADHSWEDHDFKGISLKKGDLSKPYADVMLPWKAVEKRIRKLIQEDKYLSPKAKEAYAEYKEEQAQKQLEKAQAKIERDTKVSCKDAIDRAIAENFDGYRLPKGTAEGVIKEYGIERVNYVLANTVMHRRQEARISPENKEWAKSIEPYAMYESRDIVASSHPAVLNGFINQARRYIWHEKELAAQAEAEQAQNDISDVSEGELEWHIVHDMDDDNGQPTEWSAKLPNGEFLWIDKETEGYALYDTHNTDASPVSVSETLDEAKESGEDYAALEPVDVEVVEKVKVALESSKDFSEPSIGFYTHQYADGRDGVRYRLVTTAEDGLLIPYPEHNRFFINRELAQAYIDTHANLIDVIGYGDIVLQSMRKQSQYKREQTQKETSGHDVKKSEDTIFIDGQECIKTDEWKSGDDVYVLGNSVEDSDFFYVEVNGNTHFEYDHKPDRAEIEDDFIDLEAMRDIDRHEAEVFSRFEGGGVKPDFYYAISLTSDAFADSYCISVIDGSTGEEMQHYRDRHGDMPTFETVDEAVDYCRRNGIDFQNAGEVDQWHTIEVERKNDIDHRGQEPEKTDPEKPDYKIGDTVIIEGTEFIIEDISDREVQLRDPKLLYPIFRAESRENFERLLERETENTLPEPDRKSPAKQAEPKIDKSGAVNFHITDDAPGNDAVKANTGYAPKEKFRRNIEAIRTLEKIEGENRIATPEEQKILSQYVGWGGLADVFDAGKSAWAGEYQELKSLLSDAEYASARESTLNAHYTSPVIIRSIYEALENMGFKKGNVLEPAMGIGNFFGMLPEKMQDSRLYGVELDGITGRIAKQLYPKANIKISGFEKTDYPNDFFDVAVGNVPFGQYKVADRQYDKNNFLIHDYFFAKALDKVRPGGVVAFVTSKGTMDKKSPEVRKYLAQRAELLGAVRLPNTAFKENAGTEVTSDILFLKKRDRVMDLEPDWVHLSEDENGIAMNSYFAEHSEMIVGKMEMVSGPYGMESTCQPDTARPFAEQLREAISRIDGEIEEAALDELDGEIADRTIPADPYVKNYSYTLVDNQVYYRENSIMKPVEMKDSMLERIKGMVGIRDCTQELISVQLEEYPDTVIQEKQAQLNSLYDAFSKKYGLINSQTNKRAFNQDSSYCLLCSLEKTDEEGKFTGKADMFTKRTIKKAEVVTSVDTATEALAVSLSEKARVDLDYMAELSGKDIDTIKEELTGVIFQNPVTDKWETADEYLSGNVRDKLETAKVYAENHPEYTVNVQALTQVQPKELDASEIEVRIGATWVKPEYLEDFMRDTFETPQHLFDKNVMGIQFSDVTGQWNVKGKNADYGNALVNMTYGTSRRNAYQILEDSLNLKDSRVYDTIEEDGKEKRVLNKKETTLAAQKQDTIREAFKDWVFRDPDRRQDLVAKYNKLFNSTRPREYDGAHLKFPGMTPDIELKPHQKSAVAHVLYGDNTLLAHCVGAGKTFEMTAAAMESRRLGLCQKSLFVVPNHLTEQWAGDFLRLYPGANILAATKKDFEPANRKKFCSRIATGDYDAVIIGHSQFEKIPLSIERQEAMIERQISEIELAIEQAKADNGERYTIKQMEKTRKSLMARLEKLNDTSRKDNVVTFEQLGVDRLFVDESHFYKNLFLYTKMRNVAGIAQSEAQKSSDMFAKCQYLDELTGGKGVTFATGTPISNSMTELYTNMRYLQYGTLQKLGLGHFDSWASSFGETQTAIELAPEGTGYRAKTRFAKFFNLPELIALFKESADIQTPDMLKLPVPEAEYENVVLKPSEYQQDMVASLAERAEAVRDRKVDASVDNMLKITNDGRKLALDQRLINDMLPDNETSKAATCVGKAFEIWEQTKEQKSTQLIFCDLSTPKGDGTFNVYEDIKNKLVEKGVPPEEIAFIHEANTETRKAELFGKVRSGQVRFLLGSTQKMGAGTNVQDRLIALHHLDVPWRPSDIEQQEGRILRQGNLNPKVKIFRYVTEGTFDSYSWQLIENKQKFIGQIMTSKSPVRSCEDVDEAALTYAEVKALATGNPYIKEKMDLDIQVSKLKLMKANHTSQKYRLEDNIAKHYPQQIAILKERISGMTADIQTAKTKLPADKEQFVMKVGDKVYTDKKEAGTALVEMCKEMKTVNVPATVGEYAGFKMAVSFDSFNHKFVMNLKGQLSHNLEIGSDPLGNISRINHALESMPKQLAEAQTKLENVERQLETAKVEVTKPFAQEAELAEKMERLSALNALLNMDEKGDDALGMDDAPEEENEGQETSGHDVQKLGQEEKTETRESVADAPTPYPVENARHNYAVDNSNPQGLILTAGMADKPVQRASLKEKLEAFKVKAAGGDAEKAMPKKAKEKAETL